MHRLVLFYQYSEIKVNTRTAQDSYVEPIAVNFCMMLQYKIYDHTKIIAIRYSIPGFHNILV